MTKTLMTMEIMMMKMIILTLAVYSLIIMTMMMITLALNSLKHDKDFDDNFDDQDDDPHICSVLAHAVLLKHDQGLQSSPHKGIQVFPTSPNI